MTKKMRTNRSFTLLEIAIVLILLGFIGTLTAIQIKKLLDTHRFEREISQLYTALQEAQILSAVYQTDIAIDFFRKQETWYYCFSTDEPFPPQRLNQQTIALGKTARLCFNDSLASSCHFDVYSGRIEPYGILRFQQTPEETSRTLFFDMQYGFLLKQSYTKPQLLKSTLPAKPK
jgi:type II secretory pathway pseudopilin PulG